MSCTCSDYRSDAIINKASKMEWDDMHELASIAVVVTVANAAR